MVSGIREKMRLCYIADAQSIHTQRLVRHFASEGHQVFLLSCTPIPDGLNELNLTTFSLKGLTLDNDRKTASFPWIEHQFDRAAYLWGLIYGLRLGYGFPAPVGYRPPLLPKRENQYILNLELCAQETRNILRKIQPNIVHGHFLTNHGFVAARTGFRPLVVSAWGSDVLLRPQSWFMMKTILRYVLRTADFITSDAESMTKVMLRYGANPCKVVTFPWGVDTDIFHSDEDSDKTNNRRIVFSSRMLEPVYNVELLLRAIPLVREKIPGLTVLIAGNGSLKDQLEGFARQLKLDNNVAFIGLLPIEELARHYREADVYVSVPFSDSTSVSLLEAMASGAFPIGSDLPANREWIEDGINGFLVPTDSPRLLADRMVQAFEHRELRTEAARRNIEIVRTRALWQESVRRLEQYYYQLLA